MELRVLNYFLAVAREENFTKAAKQLHVTQPTLSRQIAQLEEELGVKLFQRSNHNIILTEDGMMLKRRAQEILTLADRTKRDFLRKEANLEGTIAIGSGEFLSTRILTDCMAAFRTQHPLVRYELYSGHGGSVRERLDRGLLDVGLMAEPVDIRKYEFIPMPIRERWGVLVREDSALAQRTYITPEDLVGLPLVSATSDIAQSNIGAWLGQALERVEIIGKGNLLYNEALLARSSQGAVIAIQLDCHYDGLKFIPFQPPLENGTALAWKKEQMFPAATTAFLAFAKQYIAGISDDRK